MAITKTINGSTDNPYEGLRELMMIQSAGTIMGCNSTIYFQGDDDDALADVRITNHVVRRTLRRKIKKEY